MKAQEHTPVIVVIGAGYVGLVTAACFAEVGYPVTLVDIDEAKLDQIRRGKAPIVEPGLEERLQAALKAGTLVLVGPTTAADRAYCSADIIFLCVGTPVSPSDNRWDLRALKEACQSVGVARRGGSSLGSPALVVIKSTAPPGTYEKADAWVGDALITEVVVNPEFLAEGRAVQDFTHPDRVVVGALSDRAREVMAALYRPFLKSGNPLVFMSPTSAEVVKIASNYMLAMRVSAINEVAELCSLSGADVEDVRKAVGADPRIGMRYLYPGVGFGGSCFGKDLRGMVGYMREKGSRAYLAEDTLVVNDRARTRIFEAALAELESEDGASRVACLWGLAFKPGTGDVRDAPSLTIAEKLAARKVGVRVHDPCPDASFAFTNNAPWPHTSYLHRYKAADGARVLILLTEWGEYRNVDWARIKRGGVKCVIDGRNIWDPAMVRAAGLRYHGVGRP